MRKVFFYTENVYLNVKVVGEGNSFVLMNCNNITENILTYRKSFVAIIITKVFYDMRTKMHSRVKFIRSQGFIFDNR